MAERARRRLAAIVAADVAGYSRLIEADEEGTLAALRAHRVELIDPLLADYGGRVANTAGDSLLLEFPSVVDAVRCALAIQQGMAERNADVGQSRQLRFRIGINVGDVVTEGGDLLGDGVNVAARVEGLAVPGGIAISDDGYRQVRDRLGVGWQDGGEHSVKNIARPIQIWRWSIDAQGDIAGDAQRPASAIPLPDKPSIAVLPFVNMTGDPEQDYFADGIAEDIITDLSKISGLFVIARNSSFAFRGRAEDVRRIARDLGVRHVVEGSVRTFANRVRISAQLIDGSSGGHLWADRYDRNLDDLFAVQDDVTRSIVGTLQLKLSAGERRRVAHRDPVDLDAFKCYLKARRFFGRFTKHTNDRARDLFEQAFALDPSFGLALVGVAACHLRDVTQAWAEQPVASLTSAKVAAERAIALDATLAEAHAVRGYALLWQSAHDDALANLERGIGLEPNNAFAHAFYAMALNYAGRPREGVREAELALRLDPHRHPMHAAYLFFLGFGHFLNGNYEKARNAFRQSSTVAPDFIPPRVILAAACAGLGRHDQGRAAVTNVRAMNPQATLRWIAKTLPFKNAADRAKLVAALRAVDFPE